MKNMALFIAGVVCALSVGCSPGSGDGGNTPEPARVETITIDGLDDSIWVYISLESGKKMGTSPLGDEEQDAVWKARKDWDIALCGEMVRTNGGTSGNGLGAIRSISNKNFNALDEAPLEGYAVDTGDVIIKR